jgi:hypothetical protein
MDSLRLFVTFMSMTLNCGDGASRVLLMSDFR